MWVNNICLMCKCDYAKSCVSYFWFLLICKQKEYFYGKIPDLENNLRIIR